jgi:DNA-binding CsgD family transcriptional regulator
LVLLDRSLKVLAYNRGAAAILRDANQPAVQPLTLPTEILDNIRQCKLTSLSALRLYLRIGKNEYMCRASLLEWLNWLASQPIVAVHLMRILTSNDAVHDACVRYRLTGREQEALRGISLGLANKTIADRMAISPNTVKAFLRGIMIKMGVTSRAGIVATMLQNRATARSSLSGIPPKSEVKEMPVAKSAAVRSSPLAHINA